MANVTKYEFAGDAALMKNVRSTSTGCLFQIAVAVVRFMILQRRSVLDVVSLPDMREYVNKGEDLA
jgi:hypothetical protein